MNKQLTYKELEDQVMQYRHELASKNDEVNKIKSSFLANVSHEIRTPMNVIVGFSNLLGDHSYDQDQIGFFVDEINKNSKELLRLIDNVILTAKAENDHVDVNMKICDVNSLMKDLYNHFQKILLNSPKPVKLNFATPDNISGNKVFTDPQIMKEVMNNLIENAVKYAINGSLEFGYRVLNEKKAEFFIRDVIPVINSNNKNRLQRKINGNENTDLNDKDHHGLRLTMTESMVRLLGGNLTVKSNLENGSSFNFTIPLLVEKLV